MTATASIRRYFLCGFSLFFRKEVFQLLPDWYTVASIPVAGQSPSGFTTPHADFP